MVAIRVSGALIAASAVLVALGACATSPDATAAWTTPTISGGRSVDVEETPAPTVPEVPTRSAALEDNRTVAPPAPSRVEIPDLGVDVIVQPVGLDEQGRMGLFKDPAIAPRHAIIHAVSGGYDVEDQGSATGTFVNDKQVRRARLRSGDAIRIGGTVLTYQERAKS